MAGLERYGNGWRWLDGSMLTINSKGFWHTGEPNNAGGDENGVHMYANGLTNDVSRHDHDRYHAICEMEM